ncbi:MAG: hypothetical protein QXS62_04260 [Sulfolobales archaeon]
MGVKLAFVPLAETRLRPVEASNLTLDQVDIESSVIRPSHFTKTRRVHIVPLRASA